MKFRDSVLLNCPALHQLVIFPPSHSQVADIIAVCSYAQLYKINQNKTWSKNEKGLKKKK